MFEHFNIVCTDRGLVICDLLKCCLYYFMNYSYIISLIFFWLTTIFSYTFELYQNMDSIMLVCRIVGLRLIYNGDNELWTKFWKMNNLVSLPPCNFKVSTFPLIWLEQTNIVLFPHELFLLCILCVAFIISIMLYFINDIYRHFSNGF